MAWAGWRLSKPRGLAGGNKWLGWLPFIFISLAEIKREEKKEVVRKRIAREVNFLGLIKMSTVREKNIKGMIGK